MNMGFFDTIDEDVKERETTTSGHLMDKAEKGIKEAEEEKKKADDLIDLAGAYLKETGYKIMRGALSTYIATDEDKEYLEKRNKAIKHIKESNPYLKNLTNSEASQVIAEAPEYNFDYNKALQTGISSSDIVNYLRDKAVFFKIDDALKSGASPDDIVNYLNKRSKEFKDIKISETLGRSGTIRGVFNTLSGIYNNEQEVAHALGIKDDEEYLKAVKSVTDFNKDLEDVTDTDFLSSYTLGKFLPMVATYPSAVEAKLATLLGNSILKKTLASVGSRALIGGATAMSDDYTMNHSTNMNPEFSPVAGAIGATGAVAIPAVGNKIKEVLSNLFGGLSKPAIKKARDYYQSQFNLTEDELSKIKEDYLKFHKSIGDEADDIMAMIYNVGKMAKEEVRYSDALNDIASSLNNLRKTKIVYIQDSIKDAKDPEHFANILSNRIQEAKDTYSTFKNNLIKDYDHIQVPFGNTFTKSEVKGIEAEIDESINNLPDEIKDALSSTGRRIRESLNEDTLTPSELLELHKDLNTLIRTTSSKNSNKLYQLNKIKNKVSDLLKKNLNEDDRVLWSYANKLYADTVGFMNGTKLGKKFKELIDKDIEPESFSKLVLNMENGSGIYEKLAKAFGNTKVLEDFERHLIKYAVLKNKHLDDFSYELISKALHKQGFITKEGNNYKKLFDTIKDTFRLEEDTKGLVSSFKDPSFSRSADFYNKVMSYVLDGFFRTTHFFGLGRKKGLNAYRLNRVLKKSKVRDDFLNYVKTMSEPEKEAIINKVKQHIDNTPKITTDNRISGMNMPDLEDVVDKATVNTTIDAVDNLEKEAKNLFTSKFTPEQANLLYNFFDKHIVEDNKKRILKVSKNNRGLMKKLSERLGVSIKDLLDMFHIDKIEEVE